MTTGWMLSFGFVQFGDEVVHGLTLGGDHAYGSHVSGVSSIKLW